jgi:Rrf2 family iron-sulfur cluster assembly transcriptional regulator
MLTTTSEYAIRAMVYIAQQADGDPVLAREIAAETGVPSSYTSKILRDLAHAGILNSTRGVGGGFRLAQPARSIHLIDIVAPFENKAHRTRCPFSDHLCSEEHPCGAHSYFKPVKQAYDKFLQRTTLQGVAQKQLRGAGSKGRKTKARKARRR